MVLSNVYMAARKKKQTGKDSMELSVVQDICSALTSTLKLNELLNAIMEKVEGLINPSSWFLLLVDEQTGGLSVEICSKGLSESLKGLKFSKGEGLAGWAVAEGKALHVKNPYNDKRFSPKLDRAIDVKTEEVLCAPIIAHGETLGVIELIDTEPERTFNEDDIFKLKTIADFAAIAVENSRYVKKIEDLTISDDCTRLYNARYLRQILDREVPQALRYGSNFSIIFLDLDKFKGVNDVHGHLIGSQVLREVAELILGSIRAQVDYAFRYGGDEFVILLPRTPKKGAVVVAERVREVVRGNVFCKEDGYDIRISASFGVATFPDDASSREEILEMADKAMYAVKGRDRDGVATADSL